MRCIYIYIIKKIACTGTIEMQRREIHPVSGDSFRGFAQKRYLLLEIGDQDRKKQSPAMFWNVIYVSGEQCSWT